MFFPRAAGPARQVAEPPFVIAGVGSASRATPEEIIGLISDCLCELRIPPNHLLAIATHLRKAGDPVLVTVASHFSVPLRLLDNFELGAPISGSDFVLATVGAPSVAEAAALAAGTLALPKRQSAYATCALAEVENDFELEAFGRSQLSSASASIAASTVPTSRAAP